MEINRGKDDGPNDEEGGGGSDPLEGIAAHECAGFLRGIDRARIRSCLRFQFPVDADEVPVDDPGPFVGSEKSIKLRELLIADFLVAEKPGELENAFVGGVVHGVVHGVKPSLASWFVMHP